MTASAERFRAGEARLRPVGGFALASVLAGASLLAAAPLSAEDKPAVGADDLTLRRLELRGVEDVMGESRAQARKLEEEVAGHAAIRENLNRTLIEATEKLQEAEARAAEIEARLETLGLQEKAIVGSLESRRATIVEVLMVLQRMGRRPPPALLARPQDILDALRAALALGDLLPQMRAEAQALQTDLSELLRLRDGVRQEQARLDKERTALAEQRQRLGELIEMRQEALSAAQSALLSESERAEKLARQATSLKELITRMEAESEAARKAAEAARKADAERAAAQAKLDAEQRRKALAAPSGTPRALRPPSPSPI
ncbi:hypothetical protein WOA01_08405 [Methylocystis sp. IM2]|uniref:murein hydrolase activator EnvC family protein n=1 Tax=Methylocystis sp. IM2 TaxID=3136563 RepID=UPI0030F85DA5